MIKHLAGRSDKELEAAEKAAFDDVYKVKMLALNNSHYILGGIYKYEYSHAIAFYFKLKHFIGNNIDNNFSYSKYIYKDLSVLKTPNARYHNKSLEEIKQIFNNIARNY